MLSFVERENKRNLDFKFILRPHIISIGSLSRLLVLFLSWDIPVLFRTCLLPPHVLVMICRDNDASPYVLVLIICRPPFFCILLRFLLDCFAIATRTGTLEPSCWRTSGSHVMCFAVQIIFATNEWMNERRARHATTYPTTRQSGDHRRVPLF